MVWLAMFLFAISNPFVYTGVVMATTSLLPPEKLSTGMGLFTLMMGCGNALFVASIGLLLTNPIVSFKIVPIASAIPDSESYSKIFLILLFCLCLICLIYRKIHDKKTP